MHISKEGDPYLRTLLVQGAQHILGPFGIDCDLRRWGLKLAERGGRSGKKRAMVATARKRGVAAPPVGERGSVRTATQQQPNDSCCRRVNKKAKQSQNRSKKRTDKSQSRVPVTALVAWPGSNLRSITTGRQTDGSTG